MERSLAILDRQGEDVAKISNIGRIVVKQCPIKANV